MVFTLHRICNPDDMGNDVKRVVQIIFVLKCFILMLSCLLAIGTDDNTLISLTVLDSTFPNCLSETSEKVKMCEIERRQKMEKINDTT